MRSIVLRTCAIYILIWMIPQLLFIHTAALAEDPHAKILPSLVFLKATAQGNAGADTGVPKSTVATGVIVSDDGLILTVYHLLSELGKVEPETIDIRGSIGEQEDVPSRKVLVINANQPSDLLLLKIRLPPGKGTPFVILGNALNHPDNETIYSSGFPSGQPYLKVHGTITSRDAPSGALYATDMSFGAGQSGSPIYDETGKLLGVAKGTLSGSPATNYFIPIEFADPLLTSLRIKELTTSVHQLQQGLKNLRENISNWDANFDIKAKQVTISYKKLWAGDPYPSSIEVKITPYKGSEQREACTRDPADESEKHWIFTNNTPNEGNGFKINKPNDLTNPADSGTFLLEQEHIGVYDRLQDCYKSRVFDKIRFDIIAIEPDNHRLPLATIEKLVDFK